MTMQGVSGYTSLSNLGDGMNTMVASARATREYKGQISRLCEKHTLKRGTGVAWIEPQFDKLFASEIGEHTILNAPQQQRIVRVLRITPRGVAVQRIITDPTRPHMSPIAWRKMGMQMQEAMVRKMDEDGLAAFNASVISMGSAGSVFDTNKIRQAGSRLTGNPDEPTSGMIYCVAHRYQIHDIEEAIAGNFNNANYGEMSRGLTAEVFRNNFKGKVGNASLFEDNHIVIDEADDADAVVFARESLVCIADEIMTREEKRIPEYGEGANLVIMRDKYQYGLRRPDIWSIRIKSDATTPA